MVRNSNISDGILRKWKFVSQFRCLNGDDDDDFACLVGSFHIFNNFEENFEEKYSMCVVAFFGTNLYCDE